MPTLVQHVTENKAQRKHSIVSLLGSLICYCDITVFSIGSFLSTRHDSALMKVHCVLLLYIPLLFSLFFFSFCLPFVFFFPQMIQDWVLFIMVGVLIAIDVVYLVIVTAIPTTILQLEDVEMPSNVCL